MKQTTVKCDKCWEELETGVAGHNTVQTYDWVRTSKIREYHYCTKCFDEIGKVILDFNKG